MQLHGRHVFPQRVQVLGLGGGGQFYGFGISVSRPPATYLWTRNRLCCTFTMLLRETQLTRWWTAHKVWTALTVYHEEEEEDDEALAKTNSVAGSCLSCIFLRH